MEDYNRNEKRYQPDNYTSQNERNFEMNWDRNPANPNRQNREGRNVYSSDRENEYWNARNKWRSSSPENNYENRHYHSSYNDRDSDYRNNRSNDYRNQYYSDRYNNYQDINDYHSGYYLNYPDANFSRNRDSQWRDNERGWWDKTKDEVASWFGDDDAERRRRRDEMRSGPHRGKGPKNYTRSEERIREDVSDKLSEDSFLDASAIEVSVKDGEVTLSGSVESRYSKHRAEDLAEDVTGVKEVQNNLRVIRNEENTIYKNSVNNGDMPITSNTKYTTTKNQDHSIHG
jgi:osmotically-inducible protein OsmY